jgi:hypothetical protein
MKTAAAATALALFGLAPALSLACEYDGSTSASVTPPSQLAATPAPAATRMPASATLTAPAAKPAAKQAANKNKEAAPDTKVAIVTIK